jgi:ADP-ribose pyrophosphatase
VSDDGSAQVSTRRIYTGKVLNLDMDRVRFPNGKEGELEMIRHSGASAVVPFLTDLSGEDPQVLLLKQYRYAAEQYLYEIPAGRLDPGEAPEDCARRELREETGCECRTLERLTTMYSTPGFTDERIHLFVATGLTHGESELEADEFAEPVAMTLSEALRKVEQGEISDGKTIVGLLFVAGFRAGA